MDEQMAADAVRTGSKNTSQYVNRVPNLAAAANTFNDAKYANGCGSCKWSQTWLGDDAGGRLGGCRLANPPAMEDLEEFKELWIFSGKFLIDYALSALSKMNLWKGPNLEPAASGATLGNLPGSFPTKLPGQTRREKLSRLMSKLHSLASFRKCVILCGHVKFGTGTSILRIKTHYNLTFHGSPWPAAAASQRYSIDTVY